jgi:hypothetical protein
MVLLLKRVRINGSGDAIYTAAVNYMVSGGVGFFLQDFFLTLPLISIFLFPSEESGNGSGCVFISVPYSFMSSSTTREA